MYEVEEREFYRVWRKRNNVKLKDVSALLNLSISTISRFENNEREITADQVNKYNYFIKTYTKKA